MIRLSIVATLAGSLLACGDDDPPIGSTEIVCGEGTSAPLAPDGWVTVEHGDAQDLFGAAVWAQPSSSVPAEDVTIGCAEDQLPDGYIALGPAVAFGPAGTWSDRPYELTLPYKPARLPPGATRRDVRVVATRHLGDPTPFFPPVSNFQFEDEDPYAALLTFRAGEFATYQVVAREDAGETTMRQYTFRAIIGISMGGGAATAIGLRNHDRFDLVASLGGEPGPSMVYTLSMVRDYLFGGFCTAAHAAAGIGEIGELCADEQRAPGGDQFEAKSDFDHMLYQEGDGVGLTLNRNLYMKAARDLSRALSNPAMYNPDDPYLPLGVDWAYVEQSAAVRCQPENRITLDDFYDAEFNPDGAYDVITFCDGGDSPTLGLGVYDPDLPQENPAEILLAVDVDGDGVRDPGEPIVTNAYEPFDDVGSDGVASADETGPLGGFDAVTNPDPAGDDYHYQRNPLGTERNFNRDDGEAYQDIGLDGVAGTCQYGDPPEGGATACWDFGEGDGAWTLSPNVERWYANDMGRMLSEMPDSERDRMSIWMDAGIRDFLNASVSANVGMASIMSSQGLPGAVFDGFSALDGSSDESLYDFTDVDWARTPRNAYLRYGDPDAEPDQIERGDGRHVGTAVQVVNRATTAFSWMNAQWPDGDYADVETAGEIIDDMTFIPPTTGRETPFGLFLPPGYDDPANADVTYPVIYFLHGYGQDPTDLVILSAVFETYMRDTDLPAEDRFQKFIIVYVDGRCRPNQDGVPVPADGDGCERGTFYMDAPLGGQALMETNTLELMDYIDATYRTRPPEMIEVVR